MNFHHTFYKNDFSLNSHQDVFLLNLFGWKWLYIKQCFNKEVWNQFLSKQHFFEWISSKKFDWITLHQKCVSNKDVFNSDCEISFWFYYLNNIFI